MPIERATRSFLLKVCAVLPPCALVLGLVSACGDDDGNTTPSPTPVLDGGDSGSTGPVDAGAEAEGAAGGPAPPSRPTATACSRKSPRPAGNATADSGLDASIECTLDTECTTKPDGRCNELRSLAWYGNESLGTRCTYDACTTDDQCASGVCGCDVGFAGQNVCLPQGNCRIDSECQQGQGCSFSRPFVLNAPGVIVTGNEQGGGSGVPRESLGWFCTTPQDECKPGQRMDGGASAGCVYGPDQGRWIWWYQP